MKSAESVKRVIQWIERAESQVLQVEGSYADGESVAALAWLKQTLITAPNLELQRALIEHWIGTGLLPPDFFEKPSDEV